MAAEPGQPFRKSPVSITRSQAEVASPAAALKQASTVTRSAGGIAVQDLVDGCDDGSGGPVDCLGDGTRRVAELTCDLSRGETGEDLGIVLGAGQDVVIRDVEEGDSSGLVGAVHERRDVVGADELEPRGTRT